MSVSIITPATAKTLTTALRVRADLGLGATKPTDDQIKAWVDIASARAITFCRRQFGRETVREEICLRDLADDGDGVLFDRWPFIAAASVALDGVALDPTDYQTDDRRLYRLRDGVRTCWRGRRLVVVYEAGWFLPSETGPAPAGVQPLPADIEHAVALLVAGSVYAAGRDTSLRAESSDGVGSWTYLTPAAGAKLPSAEAEMILTAYQRARIG